MSWLILLALLKKLDKKIDDLETVTFRKVDELPATGEANVIYFVPKTDAEEGNYSDEYIWDSASETYEQIGDSAIDPLPEVTAADNGKVLGVANGEWDKVDVDIPIKFYDVIRITTTLSLQNGKKTSDIGNDLKSNVYVILRDKTSSTRPKYYIFVGMKNNGEQNALFFNIDSRHISFYEADILHTLSQLDYVPGESGFFMAHSEGEILSKLASTYSTSSTYDLGDLVIYNYDLYECTTAISTAESWTAAHWTQVKVSDELDKKANLTDIPADANHNIASAYDSTATYAVGDLCIYNGDLYECSTAISTAEAWDSTHWTQKTVAQELANAGTETVYYYTNNNFVFVKPDTTFNLYKITLINGKTWVDVGNDILNGKNVILVGTVYNNNIINYIPLTLQARTNNLVIVCGIAVNRSTTMSNYVTIMGIEINYNGTPETDGWAYTYIIQRLSAYSDTRNKFLKTNSKGDGYLFVDSPVPAVTSSDKGKALLVNSSGEWAKADLPTELPAVTSSDEGKVLTVDSNGAWVASALPDGTNQQY